MAWDGAGSQGDEEEVKAVDRDCEIGDKLGTGDEGDDRNGPKYVSDMYRQARGSRTYMQKPPSRSHTKASSHPCVLSPRR